VRRENLPAITLYENLGYTCLGIRPRYYPNGDDAMIMTKRVRDV
jgi:ribosomal protein S18 acetylase RimI-like enzyme